MISKIVDKHIELHRKRGLNFTMDVIPSEMVDKGELEDIENTYWKPIDSTLGDDDISAFESVLGHRLPLSYIIFLKHKHFFNLDIGSCWFCPHPLNYWSKPLHEMIFDGWPKDWLLDKGRLPFANWEDWGLLCFDVSKGLVDGEYPVILWDHDRPEEVKPMSDNFKSLLQFLDNNH